MADRHRQKGPSRSHKRLRILVADSAPVFRAGLATVLRREGFEVVEAADWNGLQAGIADSRPDFALLDLGLPPDGGVAACARLAGECSTRLVVWSLEPTREAVLGAIQAGSAGYLSKDISARALSRALRGGFRGEAVLPRNLAGLVIEAVHSLERSATARERVAALSPREREVLRLVAFGARNKEVAGSLVLSELTVKRHMQNIFQKLGLRSRRAAAAFYWSANGGEAPAARAERLA